MFNRMPAACGMVLPLAFLYANAAGTAGFRESGDEGGVLLVSSAAAEDAGAWHAAVLGDAFSGAGAAPASILAFASAPGFVAAAPVSR